MRDDYYRGNYNRSPYGSTAMDTYGRRYGADTFREYDKERYNPKDYMDEMQENYQIYNEQNEYTPKNASMQNLNDTLESIVNVMAMLKKKVRSPEEMDLIRRYIVTLNNL